MSFKVVIDSCGELTDEMKASGCFETASLMIQVDDHNIVDDATFDQADFLRRVAASPNCPKSSCPSPEAYRAAFDCDADHVFAVTLSSKLSGSYNSAVLGMNLLKEEKPDAKVYIFDSRSASIGETLIGKGSMIRRVLGVVAGSLIYRFIYAAALRFNVPAEYMKLVSAVIVGVAIAAPEVRRWAAFQMQKRRALAGRRGA